MNNWGRCMVMDQRTNVQILVLALTISLRKYPDSYSDVFSLYDVVHVNQMHNINKVKYTPKWQEVHCALDMGI